MKRPLRKLKICKQAKKASRREISGFEALFFRDREKQQTIRSTASISGGWVTGTMKGP
jgi:hypothetical protein